MNFVETTNYTTVPVTTYRPIPENLYEFIVMNKFIKSIKFFNKDVECIHCKNCSSVEGFYDSIEDKFYTLEEMCDRFTNEKINIAYNNETFYITQGEDK